MRMAVMRQLAILFCCLSGVSWAACGHAPKKNRPQASTKREQKPSSRNNPSHTKPIKTALPTGKPSKKPRSVQKKPTATRTQDGFPDKQLRLCPRMKISNAPRANADRVVTPYKPFVLVEGAVPIAIAPSSGACLSSGFGRRNNKKHKGIDLHSRPATMIRAAGAGTIVEANYRDDYGNYVLIDHGHQVFTRYAHLQKFRKGIRVGTKVTLGTPLGMMGNTAGWPLPVHLHYELLIGNYDTPKKSFGLKPKNLFSYPFVNSGR